jgi:hypothetical protein
MKMSRGVIGFSILLVLVVASFSSGQDAKNSSFKFATIEKMPRQPIPFEIRDWRTVARDLDAALFDFKAKGENLPAIWWDKTQRNYP